MWNNEKPKTHVGTDISVSSDHNGEEDDKPEQQL